MRTIASLLLLPFLAGPAFALSISIEMTDAVPGTGLTYLDLTKVVVPDLAQADGKYEGVLQPAVRSVAYPEDEPVAGVAVSFYSAEAVTFTSDGVELIALMLETDNPDSFGGAVIAVFDPARPGEVIDLADVSSDQFTSFDHPTVLPLGQQDDGLLVSSSHSNSSQGYRSTSVIALVDGRLTEMASVFTFNENYCGMRREQNRAFAPVLSDGDARWEPFSITVTESTTLNDCEGGEKIEPGTRAVAATFSWAADSGRYQPDSTALDVLFEETEARF